MKRLLLILLLLCSPVYADSITMPQYGPNSTLTNVNLNKRWNLLTNEINGSLNNTNADTAAGFRFHEILGVLPAAGNQGRVVFLTTDDTLYFDDGTQFRAVAVLPNNNIFSGNNTFTGNDTFTGTTTFASNVSTLVDIRGGSIKDTLITNVDIIGSTLNDMQVDAATATGMLFVNGPSDTLVKLGSQGSAGQTLFSAGAGALPTFGDRAEIFTSSGTFTVPSAVTRIYVTEVGGGGGGGAGGGAGPGGGGGGGQAHINFPITVTPLATHTITIGTAGTAGTAADGDGGDGGDTKFDDGGGDELVAAGGVKGIGNAGGGTGGAGGGAGLAGSGVTAGSPGIKGGAGAAEATTVGGGGGASHFGSGGAGGSSGSGSAGSDFGGGGGGGDNNTNGGAGTAGFILVQW